jgi:hypothetical protein
VSSFSCTSQGQFRQYFTGSFRANIFRLNLLACSEERTAFKLFVASSSLY